MTESIEGRDMLNMLIIDPQKDFHEGGNLAVAGATQDSNVISSFIKTHNDKLNKVFVSLDTHTHYHIGHAGYWKLATESSEGPFDEAFFSPFTIFFTKDDRKIYVNKDGVTQVEVEPRIDGLNDWTFQYVSALHSEDNKKGYPLIWPEHCIEKTDGHSVQMELKNTLDTITDKVEYHIKGQNEVAEMYSIFQAEKPVLAEDNIDKGLCYHGEFSDKIKTSSKIDTPGSDVPDGAYLNTEFNEELYESLTKDGFPIVICGEALSHCVNWSLRDLVNKLIDRNNALYVSDGMITPGKIILLRNGSSPVSGFKLNVDELEAYCIEKGVQIKMVDVDGELRDTISSGGKRKSRKIQKKRKNTQKRNKKRRTVKK
jgi:nicotinamidase/pyrazinamidase